MSRLPPNILKNALPGKHSDGGGLYLYSKGKDDSGRAKGAWVYRYMYLKKRFELGLGSVESVSLAEARIERDRWARWMKETGGNPLEEKRRLEQIAGLGRNALTLEQVAPRAFEALRGTLKGNGDAGRWYSPVRLHVLPALGKMKIEDIHQADIQKALAPIWTSKHPTAVKALDRLAIIMRHAAAMGLDVNLNAIPNARQLLGNVNHKPKHHPALPVDQAARLYQSLDAQNTVQRALMLYMLTGGGTRLLPLRMAHAKDFDGAVWTVPGDDMKGREGKAADFRVPLTDEMQALVDRSLADCVGGYLFSAKRKAGAPAMSKGRVPVISDQAMENIMRDREKRWEWAEAYRPHGIRACFRSWAADKDPSLYAVAETALAHTVGNAVERTYNRNDYLEQRRTLMESWADHLAGRDTDSENVVSFSARGGNFEE